MDNLNYLFNKKYYRNLGNPRFEIDVKNFNQKITSTLFKQSDYMESPFESEKNPFFEKIILKISYPGLIIGMGNTHGAGTKDFNWKDDIKTERGTIRITGNLREIFHKFFNDGQFNDALRYAAINEVSVNLNNNQTDDVRRSLEKGEFNDMSIFGSVDKTEKFIKKIVDMCISGNEEVKNGFSFDYTTGQPYIPASSVKGVLRSYFKEHRQAVCEIIKFAAKIDFSSEKPSFEERSEIELLESDIFDDKDVFLDAVICSGDEKKEILSMDYITPHDKYHIKNPVPIKILKINPDVKIEFRFLLHDHTVGGKTVKKEMLAKIFKEMLSLFGVGAKTNVGYGVMS